MPSSTLFVGWLGVEGTLTDISAPVASFIRQKSVNVPPMSMPSR